jgi:hypothetical protein
MTGREGGSPVLTINRVGTRRMAASRPRIPDDSVRTQVSLGDHSDSIGPWCEDRVRSSKPLSIEMMKSESIPFARKELWHTNTLLRQLVRHSPAAASRGGLHRASAPPYRGLEPEGAAGQFPKECVVFGGPLSDHSPELGPEQTDYGVD